jgi:hypothetical protein
VKPSVGIPVFIAAVAISSFSVHLALTTNTTWVVPKWSRQRLLRMLR